MKRKYLQFHLTNIYRTKTQKFRSFFFARNMKKKLDKKGKKKRETVFLIRILRRNKGGYGTEKKGFGFFIVINI